MGYTPSTMLGFTISISGVNAGLRRLDAAANNIANATTAGFKRSRVHQVDLQHGGTRSSVQVGFQQGPIELSDGAFALGIEGDGFFRVQTPQGERFTRAGSFHVDAAGNLVTSDGFPLQPGFTIPGDAVAVNVTPQGQVSAIFSDGSSQDLGTIDTVRFANPGGLVQEGHSLYAAGPASGPAMPGDGRIFFGALEGSNVDLTDEMVSLIVSKATVKANLSALKAQDEMLGEVIDLRG